MRANILKRSLGKKRLRTTVLKEQANDKMDNFVGLMENKLNDNMKNRESNKVLITCP